MDSPEAEIRGADLVSTDNNWNQKFFSNTKILSLSKLSLSLHCDKNLLKTSWKTSKRPRKSWKRQFSFKKTLTSRKKKQFFLNPLDFHLNIKFFYPILKIEELSKEAHAKIDAEILRQIIVIIYKEQMEYLANLWDHFKTLKLEKIVIYPIFSFIFTGFSFIFIDASLL